MVKVNKAKFEMEEVETFDEISIEGLVEGASVSASFIDLMLTTEFVQSYPNTLRGSSFFLVNAITRMGESPSRSSSSIGYPKHPRLGC